MTMALIAFASLVIGFSIGAAVGIFATLHVTSSVKVDEHKNL